VLQSIHNKRHYGLGINSISQTAVAPKSTSNFRPCTYAQWNLRHCAVSSLSLSLSLSFMKSALTFRTTMVIRSPGTLLPRSERTVVLPPALSYPRPFLVHTQAVQECFGIPRFLPWIMSLLRQRLGSTPSHSSGAPCPPCSNYEEECSFRTRRGTHNGQQPLETIIDPRILEPPPTPFVYPRIFNPAPATTNLSESTFDQRLPSCASV